MNSLYETGEFVATLSIRGMSEEQLMVARRILKSTAEIYFPKEEDESLWCVSFVTLNGETQLCLIIDKDYYDEFVERNPSLEYSLFEAQPAIIEETH